MLTNANHMRLYRMCRQRERERETDKNAKYSKDEVMSVAEVRNCHFGM